MFAVRQADTGMFMPPFKGRAGGTFVEFTDKGAPRLFNTKDGAHKALQWWLAGRYSAKYNEYNEAVDYRLKAVPERRQHTYEIVPVTITYGTPVLIVGLS